MDERPVLDVRKLSIGLSGRGQTPSIIRDVDFRIMPGEFVGLVGESGSGKSVTGLAVMGLLPPSLRRSGGEILFDGRDLAGMKRRQARALRGNDISMIFQEPMNALDPVFPIGEQIAETLLAHRRISRAEAKALAVESLAAVGISTPERRYHDYPHQLSGGMRQRVMIAIALVCEPKLLVADEPTTALDVTVQAQIVELLQTLSARTGTALLFITHDLGLVSETCSRVLTMYGGEIVEDAAVETMLRRPHHPYTSGLLRSIPRLSERKSRLPSIPGRVPPLAQMPPGCRFEPRCTFADPPRCQAPQRLEDEGSFRVRCIRHGELTLPGSV